MDRNEWLRLMTELADLDRDEYRLMRAEIWSRIALRHKTKTTQQLAKWQDGAS